MLRGPPIQDSWGRARGNMGNANRWELGLRDNEQRSLSQLRKCSPLPRVLRYQGFSERANNSPSNTAKWTLSDSWTPHSINPHMHGSYQKWPKRPVSGKKSIESWDLGRLCSAVQNWTCKCEPNSAKKPSTMLNVIIAYRSCKLKYQLLLCIWNTLYNKWNTYTGSQVFHLHSSTALLVYRLSDFFSRLSLNLLLEA